MGNAFLYGNGGANILNFRVLGGTTAPANPKVNDIWINTSIAIKEYSFFGNTTVGVNADTGNVRISYNAPWADTYPSFNMFKKNAAWIRPASCVQYDGSAWVSKVGQIYNGSSWVPFIQYLFSASNVHSAFTGGYTAATSFTIGTTIYTSAVSGAVTFNYSSRTNNIINLAPYKTLYFDSVGSGFSDASYGQILVGVSTSTGQDATFTRTINIAPTTARSIRTIDVSDLTGNYYFKITNNKNNPTGITTTCSGTIYEAYLI